jgi:hypothetical protein
MSTTNEEIRPKSYEEYEKKLNLVVINDKVLLNAPVFPESYFELVTEKKNQELEKTLNNNKLEFGIKLNVWLFKVRRKLGIE